MPDDVPPREGKDAPANPGAPGAPGATESPHESFVVRPSPPREAPARDDAPAGDVANEGPRQPLVRRASEWIDSDAPPHVTTGQDRRTTRPRAPDDKAGPLVLIGGACTPHGEALQRFLTLADARAGGRIVGLTTASADPERSAVLWGEDFRVAGARRVELPVVATRRDACDETLARRIRDADGVFLGGGDQVQLVAILSGTPVGAAVRDAWSRGATVCGTSAGAAALTELTLAGGEIDEDGVLVEMYIGPGLGLLGYRALIDTHFGARRRLQRLVVAIANNPELLGLGVDEDTALVVKGHCAEVVGTGGVTWVDGRAVRYDDAAEVGLGRQRTVSHLRVGIVGPGHALDLRARELAALVEEGARLPR